MSGQTHMNMMNRQLLGQVTPETQPASSSFVDTDYRPESLMGSTLLSEATRDPKSEEAPTRTNTLNFREQIFSMGAAPQEAGEQVGLHTRVVDVKPGKGGTLFDGHKHQTEARINQAQRQVESFRQPPIPASTPEVPRPSVSDYEQDRVAKLQTLRQEAILLGRRAKKSSPGRLQTLHVQTEQIIESNPNGTLQLLRRIVKSIKMDQKRINAFRLQQERQAKKAKQGPGAFLEGGADRQTSMVEQLQIIEQAGAQHELTAGE